MRIKAIDIRRLWRKVRKFGPFLPISSLVFTFGCGRLPESFLARLVARRTRRIQLHLRPVVQTVLANSAPVPEPFAIVPDAIWVCWLQGEAQMPPVVRMCLDSIRKNAGGHPVVLVTADNFDQYVNISGHVRMLYGRGFIKPTHFADIMRVNLLAQQGGMWLDGTVWLTSPLEEDVFKKTFWTLHTEETPLFVSRARWAVFAMAAKPKNPLMVAVARCFNEYLHHTDTFLDYYMLDQFIDLLMQESEELRKMVESVPRNNPEAYNLDRLLNEQFDEEEFARLAAHTDIFKLSWKTHTPEQLERAGTASYYAKLLARSQ